MSSPKIEVLLKGCHSSIGEGPHWDTPTQSLYTVDINAGGIHRWNSKTGEEAKIKLDGPVGFVIPREKGGLVVGLNRTICAVDFDTKVTQVLAEVDQGTQNRFNDGKCDKAGRLWAGTLCFDVPFGVGGGNLCCISTDCQISKQDSGIGISNGMDWTDDNTVMYYIDSGPKRIYAYDFDHSAGTISNRRTVIDFNASSVGGLPDGMCIDCEGKIWVAVFAGSKVVRIDPETGKVLLTLDFPTTNMTSCCFGGPQLDELFVTSSVSYLPEGADEPLAGSVFRVTGLGVKGRSPNNFCG